MRSLSVVCGPLVLALMVTACGDNIDTPDSPDASVPITIGGTVTGLAGSGLTLRNNGGDELAVSASGAFTFATELQPGSPYAVTVSAQPASPTQDCTVTNASGTAGLGNVIDIAVTCATASFTVGGTVSGLLGTGLVLANNAGDDLSIAADGTFTFATSVASGLPFEVTVTAQPSGPTQTCDVAGGTGTIGGGDVTSVVINCQTDRFTVGGTVTGLAGTAVLQNNGGDDVTLTATGTFAFATTVPSGTAYAITVLTQPGTPSQTCVLTGATGTVTDADITSVELACTTNSFTVGGSVTGLAGTGLTLQNNAGDDLSITANGTFTFTGSVLSGAPYAVTVLANPTNLSQLCTVTSGAGTMGGANVTDVAVACTTRTFSISATITGLDSAGLVLQNNGGNDLSVAADGTIPFTNPVASGSPYAVTVLAQPAGQTCAVTAGSGTVVDAPVTVAVSCSFTSCAGLLQAAPTLPSGTYTIDADGAGPGAASSAYCDMTTNGGGWTNLDFANNRVLLANGIFVKCRNGLTYTATTIRCELPYFNDLTDQPLYHYRCDGADNSAGYILDHMAPLVGHQAGLELGFATMQQQNINFVAVSTGPNEFCYVDDELVRYDDARCAAYLSPSGNGNCIPTYFLLTL